MRMTIATPLFAIENDGLMMNALVPVASDSHRQVAERLDEAAERGQWICQ